MRFHFNSETGFQVLCVYNIVILVLFSYLTRIKDQSIKPSIPSAFLYKSFSHQKHSEKYWMILWQVWSQVAKVSGGHKNVWEIMQCPEFVLKCNRSVHLPAWLCFLCVLGDLSVVLCITKSPKTHKKQSRSNHQKHIRNTVKQVIKWTHLFCISVHIQDIA